jgi:hypothetical protein
MIPVFANPLAQPLDIPPDISKEHITRLHERILATGKETRAVVGMAVDCLLDSLWQLVSGSMQIPFVNPLIYEYWNTTVCHTNFLNRLELSLVDAIRKEHKEILDGFTQKVGKDIINEFEGETTHRDLARAGFRQIAQDFKQFAERIEIDKVQSILIGLFPEYPEPEIVRFRKMEDLVLRRKFKAKLVCEPFVDVKQHHQTSDVSLFRAFKRGSSIFVSAFTNGMLRGLTLDTRQNRIIEYDLRTREMLGKREINYGGLEASNTCIIDFYVDEHHNMLLRNYGDTFYLSNTDSRLQKISISTHSEPYICQAKIYLKGTAPHRLVGIRATRDTLNMIDTRKLLNAPHKLVLGQKNLQALCGSNNRVYCLTDSGSVLIVSTVSGKILLKRKLFSQRVRGKHID